MLNPKLAPSTGEVFTWGGRWRGILDLAPIVFLVGLVLGSMYTGMAGPSEAAKVGVEKININTDLRVAFRTTLEKVLKENPDEYAVMKLMPEVWGAVREVVEAKIDMFGSAGKANG